MNCPVCKYNSLEIIEIEPNLFSEVCGKCNGKWISSKNYHTWLESKNEILPEIPADHDAQMTILQFELARLCPVDKRILIKYKIGHNIPFTIDRCGNCAGVWLDEDEWETLKSRNLHDELNIVFTDPWQEQVQREEMRKNLGRIYEEKFGADEYQKIRDFKIWLDSHEKQGEILAYLKDPNPLQV